MNVKIREKAEYIVNIINNRNKDNIANIKKVKEIVRNNYDNKDEANYDKNKEDKLKDIYYIVDK